jgi:hypothetical protein
MGITMPTFSEAPPQARSIETTQMKRTMVRLNNPSGSLFNVTGTVVVNALRTTGLTVFSFSIHRLMAYSLDPGPSTTTYTVLPLVITHALTGYTRTFYGSSGIYSPRGMVKLPPHLSGPISAVTVPVGNLFVVTGATLIEIDVTYITTATTFLQSPLSELDFQPVSLLS